MPITGRDSLVDSFQYQPSHHQRELSISCLDTNDNHNNPRQDDDLGERPDLRCAPSQRTAHSGKLVAPWRAVGADIEAVYRALRNGVAPPVVEELQVAFLGAHSGSSRLLPGCSWALKLRS
jgi:hypothetical protein